MNGIVYWIKLGDALIWIKGEEISSYPNLHSFLKGQEMKIYEDIEYDEKAKDAALEDINEEDFVWDESIFSDDEVIRILTKIELEEEEDFDYEDD